MPILTNRYGWMNKVDFAIKTFCFATSQRLPRASFLFCFSKKEKKPVKR